MKPAARWMVVIIVAFIIVYFVYGFFVATGPRM
jgi:hypothetical protein